MIPSPDSGRHPAPSDGATLLVFTLGAARERARRRLLPRRLGDWELALHRDCLEAALAAGRANGCRLRVCAPRPLRLGPDAEHRPQRGGDFGARLRRAVAGERPSRRRPLVVVGSDVPGLEPRHVATALARLARDPERLVVGPSPDGGFYLLAAARPLDELLGAVVWRGRGTLASLLAAAHARGVAVSLLAPLADLDRAADLHGLLASGEHRVLRWLDILRDLLRRLRKPLLPFRLGRPRLGLAPVRIARGPPR